MASLAEKIAELTNPSPEFHDPEDDIAEETSAKVLTRKRVEADDSYVHVGGSKLRRKTAALLSESDRRYSGKTVSRKQLKIGDVELARPSGADGEFESGTTDEDEMDDDDDDDDGEEEAEEAEEQEEEGSQSEEEDENDEMTQQKQFSFVDNGDYSKYANGSSGEEEEDDDDDDEEEEEEEEEVVEDGTHKGDEDIHKSIGGKLGTGSVDSAVRHFTRASIDDEVQRGAHTKLQLKTWDSLLEGRIRMQKLLLSANQLPQHETWSEFTGSVSAETQQKLETAQASLKLLLDELVNLQTLLLRQHPETRHVADGNRSEEAPRAASHDSDEEITSEDEVVSVGMSKKPTLKRKISMDEYPDFLEKRHKDFIPYRNATIQKWNDKTKLTSGKAGKSFGAFDQSVLTQVQLILADKDRLVKRTQLKRSSYRVIGKADSAASGGEAEQEDAEEAAARGEEGERVVAACRDAHLKEYDAEIFDDDDFYHQLLRELIERKTADVTDPVALSRQWLQIQKLRSKVKKKVDTKASKGRKVRYDIHSKLVNFMAPLDMCRVTDASRNELYSSLFGKRMQVAMDTTEVSAAS
ncbi:PREDICTED: protein AATF-like [Priapulus caudatus]|uniref:Protein AATF-like n=1 Tax=Priapulus caudatus TaxID=37621 RepID=A0ABM1DQE7_PRICU|nr:PREDICTED: protein AATF-like [Priapulus caudatus]